MPCLGGGEKTSHGTKGLRKMNLMRRTIHVITIAAMRMGFMLTDDVFGKVKEARIPNSG